MHKMYEDLKLVEKFAQNTVNEIIKNLGATQKTPTIITKGNARGLIAASTIAITDGVIVTGKMKSYIEKAVSKNWKYLEKGIFAPDFYEVDSTNSHKSLLIPTGGCNYVKYRLEFEPKSSEDLYQVAVSMTSVCNDTEFVESAIDDFRSAVAITLEIGRL